MFFRIVRYGFGACVAALLVFALVALVLEAPTELVLWVLLSAGACFALNARQRWMAERKFSAQLADSAAHLAAVLKSVQHGVLLVDASGAIVMTNRHVEQCFGYQEDELYGKSVELLIPVHARSRHEAHRQSYDEAPSPRRMSERGKLLGQRKDGTVFPVDIGLSPLVTAQGRFVVASVVDLTNWAKLQDKLEEQMQQFGQANAELSNVNERLNEFAYVASHDLKAPLRAIDNLSSWIVEDCGANLPASSAKHLDQLRGRVHRMEALLDDLLEYSRAGQVECAESEVDVRSVLEGVVKVLNTPPGFSICVSGDFPTFITARVPFEQVFRNLVDNAIKHHDRSEGRIEITCSREEDFSRFVVADDGPGIPEQHRERVFKLFQTLKPRDEKEGSGMGLAVVQRIVTQYGGRVHVEANEGRGARFVVLWPLQPKKRLVPVPAQSLCQIVQ